jgi:uncharacterized protein
MGHRHTPEEQRGARGVYGAGGGLAAAAADRLEMPDHFKNNSVAAEPAKPHSIAQKLALFALRFYKMYLSMFVGGSCRFEPTCSIYAYQAVERFGAGRGSWLALKRLLRCQPLSRKFGYDPVPDAPHPSAAVTPEEVHS